MTLLSARNSILVIALCALLACKKERIVSDIPSSTTPSQVTTAKEPQSEKTYDGPFGLAAGMSSAELERVGFEAVPGHPSIFKGKPPKPVDGVDEYIVLATPVAGLCRIQAKANVPVANGTGDQVRTEVDRLASLLALRYGKHSLKGDLNDKDVYRRNPQFWMMGIQDQSILYGYTWSSQKTEKPLPNEIAFIEVTAGADSMIAGWGSMVYTFKNFDTCRQENQARAAAN
ncbi:MAG: hypothetical protein RR983_02645, partial [Massilia sp.]